MKFALTLKFNCLPRVTVTKETYEPIWDLFKKHNIVLSHVNWELDSTLRLHYHGVAEIPSNFYRKKLCLPGFHTNLLPLKSKGDIDRWIKYCYKDVPPEEWPDLCDDAPLKIKNGIRDKLRGKNIFRCCNNNTVTIKSP